MKGYEDNENADKHNKAEPFIFRKEQALSLCKNALACSQRPMLNGGFFYRVYHLYDSGHRALSFNKKKEDG
jgi:hypothetical protein